MSRETPKSRVLKGRLEIFSEQGSEGSHWSFYEDGKTGYDGLHALEKGDVLRIFNDAARTELLWQGEVDFDHNSEKQHRPLIGEVQWLDKVGTVHGLQKGVDKDVWADMFLAEKPAVLVPKRPDKYVR
ncbi:MAG: hypothetical protein Q8K65_12415 [Alphaproteobacteria bacterium]|nr:hypothetical protein [Alphaproteobacteria bacterium]